MGGDGNVCLANCVGIVVKVVGLCTGMGLCNGMGHAMKVMVLFKTCVFVRVFERTGSIPLRFPSICARGSTSTCICRVISNASCQHV